MGILFYRLGSGAPACFFTAKGRQIGLFRCPAHVRQFHISYPAIPGEPLAGLEKEDTDDLTGMLLRRYMTDMHIDSAGHRAEFTLRAV